MILTPDEYNALERAVLERRRIAIRRHGTEVVVVAEALRIGGDGESIVTRHPSTGDVLVLRLAEIDGLDVVQW